MNANWKLPIGIEIGYHQYNYNVVLNKESSKTFDFKAAYDGLSPASRVAA